MLSLGGGSDCHTLFLPAHAVPVAKATRVHVFSLLQCVIYYEYL